MGCAGYTRTLINISVNIAGLPMSFRVIFFLHRGLSLMPKLDLLRTPIRG